MPIGGVPYEPRTCTVCGGTKGKTEKTVQGGKIIEVWRPCRACGGTGKR